MRLRVMGRLPLLDQETILDFNAEERTHKKAVFRCDSLDDATAQEREIDAYLRHSVPARLRLSLPPATKCVVKLHQRQSLIQFRLRQI